MTVSASTSRADYTGNGTTTAFSVPFYFLENSHLKVIKTSTAGIATTLVLTTDYSVSGAGVLAGGTVTTVTAPASGEKISILRNVPIEQQTNYVPNDPFPAESHEAALDKLTMIAQQLNEGFSRSLTVSANNTTVSTALPSPETAKLLGWDNNGTALQNYDPASLFTVVGSSGFSTQTFSGTGAQTAFTMSAAPGLIANLDVFVSGVRQLPTTDYTLSNTTLTFTTAPPSGTNNILCKWGTTYAIGALADDAVTTAKIADSNVTTAKIADSNVTTAKIASSAVIYTKLASDVTTILTGRNRIINGAMTIDQRNNGSSQTITAGAALAYTVDRFYAYCTGANVTGQQVAGPIANTCRYQFTGAASVTGVGFGTRLEAINTSDLAGSTATLQVKLKSSSLTSITWTAYYANTKDTFGTLASPTRTQIATGTFTITSTEATYSAQISVVSSATTGIEIVFTGGALLGSQTLTVGDIQIEPGSVATTFERRQYGNELTLCQRYCQTFSGSFMGVATGATSAEIDVPLFVPMRATPTMTNLGNGTYIDGTGAAAITGASLITGYANGPCRVGITSTGMVTSRPISAVGQTLQFYAEL